MNTLESLQKEELCTLTRIVRTFEENHLKYFLGFGTLLGAVRHKGFIPWDDDVDLFMPRNDYDRFRKIADKILEKPLILTGNIINPKEDQKSIKVRVENPDVQFWTEKNGQKIKQNIWVDIFPMDGMPKTKLGRRMLFWHFRLLFLELRLGRSAIIGVQESKKRNCIERIGIWANKAFHIGKLFNTRTVVNKFESIRKRYPYEISEYVCPLTIDYMEKCICKREWFGDGRQAEFEKEMFTVPDDCDSVLKQFYGNYLELPPIEKRTCRHGIELVERQLES